MAKHRYKVLDAEPLDTRRGMLGLDPALPIEKDSELELDLTRDGRRDVIAAGWVEALDEDEDEKPKSKPAK